MISIGAACSRQPGIPTIDETFGSSINTAEAVVRAVVRMLTTTSNISA